MQFKLFLENEEKKNVKKMISLLPKGHQKLLDGYHFTFTPNNTLKGDNNHIGYIHKNKIVVAAPWNYGRGFTALHEIAHLVWEQKMTSELKKQWKKLFKSTIKEFMKTLPKRAHDSLKQNAEEIFAMTYANYYSKHHLMTYSHPEWMAFILNKVPN